MSFCRITGRSRGLPKPNYFPLLAPISPADAKRCCRITGKSYGLPSHHYIPVLLASGSGKAKCKITNVSSELGPHHFAPEINYGNRIHTLIPDYRYIFPVLDGSTEAQKSLIELLQTKQVAEDKRYVYTVQERRCSLVFSAQMEAAVRDGDVRDVMLAKDSDTVLIKTKQGRNVSMDFKDFVEDVEMYEGEGPNADVLRQREIEELEEKKRKRKRTAGLTSMKKIFENKEMLAEVEEKEEEKVRQERLSKKAKLEELKIIQNDNIIHNCENYDLQHMRNKTSITMCSGDWRDLMQPLIESWDWDSFEKESSQHRDIPNPKITTLPTPVRLEPLQCETEIYDVDQHIAAISAPVESVPCVGILQPAITKPKQDVIDAVKTLSAEQLAQTENVPEKLILDNQEHMLPNMKNVTEIVKNLRKGKKGRLSKISGLMLDIEKAKTFIPGQYVNTPTGQEFVPGQTLATPAGPVFLPGISVNTPSGPGIIPGHVITNESNEPFFVAGQLMRTNSGERFVQGQTVKNIDNSYRFVEGQTVSTSEGIKFIPGKVIEYNEKEEFVPGQTIMTPDGVQFIPGQTISEMEGEVFIPGQNAFINGEWEFVPGQSIRINKEFTFVPGASLPTPNGLKFIPGQTITIDEKTHFVPGIAKQIENEMKFVPGTTVDTIDGPKFVEGQIISTAGNEKFVAGKTLIKENGEIQFSVAKNAEDIVFHETAPMGLPIDIRTCSLSEDSLYTFGHMVQTVKGIEFYPGSCAPTVDGKIVPGRLVKTEINESRFVPGMMLDGIFVPGQTVFTENGEQFVPGQVIDTMDGPKFVPGQVVKTKSGPKFVPGQTIQTIDGPRFVPGQIIETKAGPTFIPGQVISTEEEGSRFVPGQVVDTEEGPRFVPGRVIESDDHGVTFIPGQIVQTPDGLKFVAPDLTEGESGLEFSVQSFVVTPEELKLLKIKTNPNDTPSTRGELSIDAKMLRQLSEAGMAIGRQVPADVPAINIIMNDTINKEILKSFVADYGLKDNIANQLMAVIASIVEMSAHLKNQINESPEQLPNMADNKKNRNNKNKLEITENDSGFHESDDKYHHNENIKNSIAAAVLAAMVISEQYQEMNNNNNKEKYQTILKSINTVLGKSIDENFVKAMYNILQIEDEKEILCEQILKHSSLPKVELIKMALNSDFQNRCISEESIIEKFTMFLSSENEVLGPAFKNITKSNSELLRSILSNISESVSFITTDDQATETLQKAIVSAVNETSNNSLNKMLSSTDNSELKLLIEQSVGLAKILGMSEVVGKLVAVLSNSKCLSDIANDATSMDILRRLTVMRQLAEQTPSMHSALKKLGTDPELARTDPKLRDLVRESAALMIVPEEPPLMNSHDVPFNLLQNENSLAMEDFLLQRKKHPGTLLIMKKGLQCVVPREASRAVLTGQVAYTVLDESGIRHFEPLHVFSALQLNQPTAHRFSMYSCPVVEDDDVDLDSYSTYSANINRDQRTTRMGGWGRYTRGVLLERENSASRIRSLDYTPSYRRYSSSLSRSSGSRSPPKVDDVVVATSDYSAAADDEVSLKAGDIVEVLDTKSAMGAKYRGRVYCYDSHFFQPRGYSLDYIFSAPTYRMYYV